MSSPLLFFTINWKILGEGISHFGHYNREMLKNRGALQGEKSLIWHGKEAVSLYAGQLLKVQGVHNCLFEAHSPGNYLL